MKTVLLLLRTKLFLLGFLSTTTFILANNYIQRKDPFKFTEVKEAIVAKPENSAIAKKKVAKQKMNLQLEENSFRGGAAYFDATVQTDRADYYPGDTVIITGTGWFPSETVELIIEHSTVTHGSTTLYAVADLAGTIYNNEFIIQPEHLGELFNLDAYGISSMNYANAIFTDASSVTPASSGINIPADKALNSAFPLGGTFTTLGTITVAEGSGNPNRGDFANSGTLILTAPTGWKFNPGAGGVSFTTGRDITAASISVLSNTITVSLTIPTITATDAFAITGIQVKADDGSLLPNSGNILRTSGNPGSATIVGVTNDVTNFGSLSQSPGAARNFLVESAPSGGNIPDQTTGAPFTIKITATDQFSKTATSFSGSGNNVTISSNATLTPGSVTTANFSAGVLASHSVTISPAFNGATLTATKGSATGTSNAFNVTGASGGLTVDATTCAQGGSFTITYSPESGSDVTETKSTPFTFTAKKNTSYSITSIASTVNGNTYTGATTVTGTTPNSNNFTHTVTLAYSDNTAPAVPLIANATGECSATVSGVPTATDNCVGPVVGTTADPLTYSSQGTHTIHWSFNDGNGNISTANQTVIVDDVTAPSVPVLATATGECSATVTAPTATDNCVGDVLGTTVDPLSYSEQGTFTIHWSFNDGNGNISTANQTVIVDDVTVPALPVLTTATGECSATVTAPTATDNCVGNVLGTTADPLSYSELGTFTIHWSFNDGNGNSSTATQTVIVDDITAPALPVLATATGECSATVTAPTATDNCVGLVLGTTADPLSYSEQGTFTIHWSFNDGNGNSSTANQTVVVDDVTAPALPLLATATGECSATLTAPTATDNCVGDVLGTTADPLSYSDQGTFTIHWSFNDGNGNISTANQTVIVDDITAPALPVLTTATGECSASVTAPTATDNCVGDVLGTTADPLSYSDQGTFTIHWSFNDGNGNISTANQTVIVDDVTAPSFPVLTTATGECSTTVTAPTATDNCVGPVIGTTADPLTYSEQGTFTIHWSFNDGNGNISTANQTVIVDDVTAPSLPLLTTATGECSASVTAPTATDNCVGPVLGTTADPLTYSDQGTFTIHWSFNDGNGNISTANQTVIVDDITAPALPELATVTGECSATVSAPTATDNCVGDVLGTTADPLSYSEQGTFTIHWSFNDGNGNISTANQTVTVDDITAPALPVLATTTGECSATVTAPTATDNCVGNVLGTTIDPLSYSEQGTFTIHWSFNDGNGNISTANQTVIVDDVTAPALPVLTTVSGECSASVTAPTATDNCVGNVLGTTADPLTYSDQGTFTIHWSFNDGNGNISTANQTVVVDDVTAPSLPLLATATGECSATVTAPTATDNCVGPVLGTTADPLTYSEQGTFTIHWSFNDGNGNISTANQTVIVDDITAPALPVLTTVTGECSATVTAPTATDNCVGPVLGTTADPLTYSEQGTFTIHWSFNDGNGNISTANQTVVVDDVTAPALPVLATATGECSATVTAPTATDNCVGNVLGTTADPLTYSDQGTFTIHWSFNDGNGNISTANQTVIVDDITAPVLPVLATATGECSASVSVPTATDNCVGPVTGTTNDPLTYTTQGTHTVHWSFNDGNGNTSTANQTVIVDDVTAPSLPLLTTTTGECSATVTAPTATDNCVGNVLGTTADPLSYSDQGTFTIHWSFNDGNGNISTATQTVIVDDVTAPAIPVLATATGECSASVSVPTTTDNCVGNVLGTTADPLSYSEQGTFAIHWSFNDGNGNISTATQTVIVDDVTAPALPVLTTATGECSASVSVPTTTDNCVGLVTGTTNDPLTYTTQGTHIVHWSFNDGNGNTSTASQTVVVDDVTPPALPLLTTATGECSASVIAPTTTDNCVGPVTGTTNDPLTYTTQGTHIIHWSFNDGNGNTSTATQTVIVQDVTPPSINCNSPVTANNSAGVCGAVVYYTAPVGTDNCSGSVTTRIAGLASGSIFPVGVTTNIFKVTDAGGNTATCSFTVTVNDTQKPAIACPSNIVLNACTSTANWSTPSATDNCSGASVIRTAGPASGSTFDNGTTTTIAYKATDASGNTATCSFTVTRAAALTVNCSIPNNSLYFGYSGDQKATISVSPSGGNGPYTVSITMNRPLKCNEITNSGDELWAGALASNYVCPGSGGLTNAPVSTGNVATSGGTYSVDATLMANAEITATITDANGCTVTCSKTVYAEDARCFNGNSGVAKVTICHRTGSATNPCVTICVDESAVAAHIAHGDFLGKCTPNCVAPVYTTSLGTVNTSAAAEVSVDEGFQVRAFPNPTVNKFTVSIKSNSNEKVSVMVFDALGRQVKKIERGDALSPIQFGEDLRTGVYIIEVRQGENRKTIKLLKQ